MPPVSATPLMTPVLFIVFSRPETTKLVFEAIRKARPFRLYVVADGPRANKPGEDKRCEETRKIATDVDWDCEVHTLFRTENLGCGKGVCAAITWFFEREPEGIILEDDCLPSPTFFTFCAELLARYRFDTRVMQIGGNNFEAANHREKEYSYLFSNMVHIWGWATWRRAWKFHDFRMNHYKEIREKGYLDDAYDTIHEKDFYQYVFDEMYNGSERTWDYQWQFACKINSGLTIIPHCNLVRNLGFGLDATNTNNLKGPGYDLKLETMEFPMTHPQFIMVDKLKDRQVSNLICTSPSSRVKSYIKSILPKPVLERLVKPLQYFFS